MKGKLKKLCLFAVACIMAIVPVFTSVGCNDGTQNDKEQNNQNNEQSGNNNNNQNNNENPSEENPPVDENPDGGNPDEGNPPVDETPDEDATPKTYSLEFDEQVSGSDWQYKQVAYGEDTLEYYSLSDVVYCRYPTHPDLQQFLFYVPAAYLNEDGTLNKENEVNGYTSETAPMIYINSCGSYIGYAPFKITTGNRMAGVNKLYGNNWYYDYLANGFVLVFVGERGRSSTDEEGNIIGQSPISLVDLKAGIRFLKHNDSSIPGDSNKIISNGMSAGGAMSALIGVSGNTDIFDSYLEEMGACMDETDDVFATQAYCPIIDLEHSALAYEWMWQEDEGRKGMTDFQKAISAELAAAYAEYINTLGLTDEEGNPLTLAEDGSRQGSLYDWLIAQYEASYNHYVELTGDTSDAETYDWLVFNAGTGASLIPTETIDALGALVLSEYNPRQKVCITFDQADYAGDNGAFYYEGSARHFTPALPSLFEKLREDYPEEYDKYYQVYYDDVNNADILQMIEYFSPYHYITDGNTDVSQYFRINVGTQDSDTSPTVSAVLALLLNQAGIDVEYNLIWNLAHIDADCAGEFEAWVNSICKA